MCDQQDSIPNKYTLVCHKCEADGDQHEHTDAFLALICHRIERDRRSLTEVAEALGMSRRKLGRLLCGERPLLVTELRALTDILGIDRVRAIVAVEVLGDWRGYDEPALNILLRLIKPAFDKIEERADFAIEPLADGAEDILTDWLANTIIANEKDMRHRRNEFLLPHKI